MKDKCKAKKKIVSGEYDKATSEKNSYFFLSPNNFRNESDALKCKKSFFI